MCSLSMTISMLCP